MAKHLIMIGKSLRALTTTFIRKLLKGTRLIDVHNGNNVKDWVIRAYKPKSVMIGYGFCSTTARVLVDNDSLINLNLLKIQSSPL